MKSSPELEKALDDFYKKGALTHRSENNRYLKVSYRGTGGLISEKWNVKIYTSGSIVCNDIPLLLQILKDDLKEPNKSLKLVQIDDAGIGFPLCGVMIGICLENEQIFTDTVDVKFFQGKSFEEQEYLQEYAYKGSALLHKIGVNPQTHRIEICTGFINTRLKDLLRKKGFDVRVTEIKGLLQDKLENLFKKHILKETGYKFTYDPKEVAVKDLGRLYYNAVNYGKARTPHKLKSGWKSLNNK